MKKNLYLVLFIVAFFICTGSVFAYTCKYDFKQGSKDDAYIKVNVDQDNFSWSGDFFGFDFGKEKSYVIDFALDDKYEEFRTVDGNHVVVNDTDGATNVLVNEVLDGKCASLVYVCSSSESKFLNAVNAFLKVQSPPAALINELVNKKSKYGILLNTGLHGSFVERKLSLDGWGIVGSFSKKEGEDTCAVLEINEEESDGEIVDVYNTECDFYNDYISKEEGSSTVSGGLLKEKYDGCNNDAKCLTEYNHEKDKLKTFCSDVVTTGNVSVDPCVDKCLKIGEDISQIEGNTVNTGECKFSDRVIKWIANIVRWVKYIAPVLVIIFGIMDFIKAIAAQNDDEMKKAQSRFIRRLIVAALVFIVPFLIEYILTAFKIVSDNPYCGII